MEDCLMRALIRSILAPAAILTLLLSSLSVAAPVYNALDLAPRSVFLHLPTDQPEPTVKLRAEPLPNGGWLIRLEAQHFQFTEICVVDAPAQPLGHAHLLLDGVKIASAYQPMIRIDALPPGQHTLRAVLRGQDHRALLGQHGLIEDDLTLEVPNRSGGLAR
jgi:hypothetical protein